MAVLVRRDELGWGQPLLVSFFYLCDGMPLIKSWLIKSWLILCLTLIVNYLRSLIRIRQFFR